MDYYFASIQDVVDHPFKPYILPKYEPLTKEQKKPWSMAATHGFAKSVISHLTEYLP